MNEDIATFLAPFTLLVGGGLVALGLLSFINLNYFKTALRARLALALGLFFILATEALFVTSSSSGRYFPGQKLDVTDCEFMAERDNPLERGKNGSRVIHDNIVACMAGLGYEWTLEHEHCKEAPIATNAFCYLPKAALQRTLVAFQMRFE
jgi:hypothetical protein